MRKSYDTCFFPSFFGEIWYITYKIDDTLDIIQFKMLRNRKVSIVNLTCVAVRAYSTRLVHISVSDGPE